MLCQRNRFPRLIIQQQAYGSISITRLRVWLDLISVARWVEGDSISTLGIASRNYISCQNQGLARKQNVLITNLKDITTGYAPLSTPSHLSPLLPSTRSHSGEEYREVFRLLWQKRWVVAEKWCWTKAPTYYSMPVAEMYRSGPVSSEHWKRPWNRSPFFFFFFWLYRTGLTTQYKRGQKGWCRGSNNPQMRPLLWAERSMWLMHNIIKSKRNRKNLCQQLHSCPSSRTK